MAEKNSKQINQDSERLKQENEELINKYYSKKEEYKKLICEFLYIKKNLCSKCVYPDTEIDYKSIDKEEIEEMDYEKTYDKTGMEDPLASFSDIHENTSIEIRGTANDQARNLKDRIEEKEDAIKDLEKQQNDQIKAYERVIQDLDNKLKMLTDMKQQIMSGQ